MMCCICKQDNEMTTLNFACKQGMRGIWPEHLVYMQDERVSISAAARVDL